MYSRFCAAFAVIVISAENFGVGCREAEKYRPAFDDNDAFDKTRSNTAHNNDQLRFAFIPPRFAFLRKKILNLSNERSETIPASKTHAYARVTALPRLKRCGTAREQAGISAGNNLLRPATMTRESGFAAVTRASPPPYARWRALIFSRLAFRPSRKR